MLAVTLISFYPSCKYRSLYSNLGSVKGFDLRNSAFENIVVDPHIFYKLFDAWLDFRAEKLGSHGNQDLH